MTDFLRFLFMMFLIAALGLGAGWVIYRHIMYLVGLVREARQYFKTKKEKQ